MLRFAAYYLVRLLAVSLIFVSANVYSFAEVTMGEGKESSFLVTEEGALWSYGKNERGQLGVGTFENSDEFIWVKENIATVSAGYEHTAAVSRTGELFLWGNNEEGQLGTGQRVDQAYPQLIMEGIKGVSAGGFHTLAVGVDGTLWSWGANASGCLGTGNEKSEYTPVKVLEGVKEAGAGWYYSAALKEDGSLWTWGWNEKGRLGNGNTEDFHTPQRIMTDVKTVAIGASHGLALKADGTLWAWGDNSYGQLGDGTRESRYKPVLIMDRVTAVAAGYYTSAAIKDDDSLWVWGTNKGFWLGDEGKKASAVPVLVKEEVAAVALGRTGSLTAMQDGRICLDDLNSNMIIEIEDGRPMIMDKAMLVAEHNENVYYHKRTDTEALNYYLQPTEKIQSDDPRIKKLAAEITSGVTGEAGILQAVHDWVCRNLYYNYDALYHGAELGDLSALGALNEEVAVCSGYANLTAALLRASGIPTKYISGYAVSVASNGLTTEQISSAGTAHAWNEAWVDGRWVIVDTTFDSNNRYSNGQFTGMPFTRAYLDVELETFHQTHMIKEYTEFFVS